MNKIILLFFFLLSSFSNAQVLFDKTFGDTSYWSISPKTIATSDGGLLICGKWAKASQYYTLLIKLDANGDTSWSTVLSEMSYYVRPSVIELPQQNGFIIGGGVHIGLTPPRGLICKIDLNGALDWAKAYTDDSTELFVIDDLAVTDDDSLVLVCRTFRSVSFIMKTDLNGNSGWLKKLSLGTENVPQKLMLTGNQEILVGGGFPSGSGGITGGILIKTDRYGNLIWTRRYGNSAHLYPYFTNIDTTSDGKYILTATVIQDNNNGPRNFYTKVDTSGFVIWQRTLPYSPGFYTGDACAFSLPGNKYGLVGNGLAFSGKTFSLLMDSIGIPYSTMVDTSWNYSSPFVAKTFNNELVISGKWRDTTSGKDFIKVVLADSLGNTACNQVPDTNIIVDTNTAFNAGSITFIWIDDTVQISYPSIQVFNGIPFCQTNCFAVLSNAEETKPDQFIIYPIPAGNFFSIKSIPSNERSLVKIFDLQGELLLSKTLFGKSENVINENFSPGIYFVQVLTGDKSYVRKLMIE